jgi:hypothetical protein
MYVLLDWFILSLQGIRISILQQINVNERRSLLVFGIHLFLKETCIALKEGIPPVNEWILSIHQQNRSMNGAGVFLIRSDTVLKRIWIAIKLEISTLNRQIVLKYHDQVLLFGCTPE